MVEVAPPPAAVMVESWAGPVRVEWDVTAPLTPFGQLPFFIQFLKTSGLFDAWVADCPLRRTSCVGAVHDDHIDFALDQVSG